MSLISRLELRDPAEARKRLRIAVTQSCNLRCFFCHGDGGEVYHFSSREAAFSPDEIATAIEVGSTCGIQKVKITGGEPLLYAHHRFNIVDLVRQCNEAANRAGVELSLVSNGLLLSRRRAEELREAGLSNITISLHSGDAATFSKYSGQADQEQFSLVLEGIENAAVSGMRVKLNSVVFYSRGREHLRNVGEIQEILRIGRERGAREIKFLVVVENPRFQGKQFRDTYVYWDDPLFSSCFPGEVIELMRGTLGDPLLAELAFPGTFKAVFYLEGEGELSPTFSFQNMRRRTEGGVGSTSACQCQEGSYAVRLLANGQLKSCLWDSRALNILPALRSADLQSVAALFRDAIDAIHESYCEVTLSCA